MKCQAHDELTILYLIAAQMLDERADGAHCADAFWRAAVLILVIRCLPFICYISMQINYHLQEDAMSYQDRLKVACNRYILNFYFFFYS